MEQALFSIRSCCCSRLCTTVFSRYRYQCPGWLEGLLTVAAAPLAHTRRYRTALPPNDLETAVEFLPPPRQWVLSLVPTSFPKLRAFIFPMTFSHSRGRTVLLFGDERFGQGGTLSETRERVFSRAAAGDQYYGRQWDWENEHADLAHGQQSGRD